MTPIQRVRSLMLIKHPFFASIMMATPMHEKPAAWFLERGTFATACTDMKSIWWCTEFFATLEGDQAMFVIAHEVMHIVLMHGLRRQGRNHSLWNIAGDYVINYWLKKLGFETPKGALYDPRFADLSAERVYELLFDGVKGATKPLPDWIGKDLIEPAEAANAAQCQELEYEIKGKLAAAANVAKLCGRGSADIERLIDALIHSNVHWSELLRNLLTAVKQNEDNWSRPNRRIRAAYFPHKRNEAAGEIVLIGDTSGSMSPNELKMIGGVVDDVREQLKPERVRVIWADDDACLREEVFEEGEPLELHPKGCGGTDMRKPLQHVAQFDPIVVLMVTDCETPWPDQPTPFPLVVCSTASNSTVPTWADYVEVKE